MRRVASLENSLNTHSVMVAVSTRSDVQTIDIHASMFYAHLQDKHHRRHFSTTFGNSAGSNTAIFELCTG